MRLKTAIVAHPIITGLILFSLCGVAVAAVPAFKASEQASFCTSCHEMTPYYSAWQKGQHAAVPCVDCHVDGGTINRVTHKVQAAKELWAHLTSDPRFPQGTAIVPNARCLSCHSNILAKDGPGFSHKRHAAVTPCADCHGEVGHRVTSSALANAGVLSTSAAAAARLVPVSRRVVTAGSVVGTSSESVVGTSPSEPASVSLEPTSATHINIVCSRCHNLDTTQCSFCHKPPHVDRVFACSTCHQTGTAWRFTHPSSPECATCHQLPAKHRQGACATCHPAVGKSWAFSHPTSSTCTSCHTAPAKHFGTQCANCHKPSVPFAKTVFTHAKTASCSGCHQTPSRHYGTRCSSCHKLGVSFAKATFVHTRAASCTNCHSRPSGHKSGSCVSCHRSPGRSWAFSHPASSSCRSCHRAPSSHFGTACASCHRSRRSWSASFHHPSTGAPHSYRTFSCTKCHPSGYRSASCTCHGGHPPSGD